MHVYNSQRLKGMTTGSLPTFVDVKNNFQSSMIEEDNWLYQSQRMGRRVVLMGDETWADLFPGAFHQSYTYPPHNVKDLHSVDDGCIEHLMPTLESAEYDILISHFAGLDHAGHRYKADHPVLGKKLDQMNDVLEEVLQYVQTRYGNEDDKGTPFTTEAVRNVSKDTGDTSDYLHGVEDEDGDGVQDGGENEDVLVLVMGDHGMTESGNHGGTSAQETDAGLFVYSSKPIFEGSLTMRVPSREKWRAADLQAGVEHVDVAQINLVPTLSLLMGLPIPFGNLGSIIPEFFLSSPSSHLSKPKSAKQSSASYYSPPSAAATLAAVATSASPVPNRSLTAQLDRVLRLSVLARALHFNVAQMHRYISEYSTHSSTFSATELAQFSVLYRKIQHMYADIIIRSDDDGEESGDSHQDKGNSGRTQSWKWGGENHRSKTEKRGESTGEREVVVEEEAFLNELSTLVALSLDDSQTASLQSALKYHHHHRSSSESSESSILSVLTKELARTDAQYRSLIQAQQQYLDNLLELCREKWTVFDLHSMISGIAILVVTNVVIGALLLGYACNHRTGTQHLLWDESRSKQRCKIPCSGNSNTDDTRLANCGNAARQGRQACGCIEMSRTGHRINEINTTTNNDSKCSDKNNDPNDTTIDNSRNNGSSCCVQKHWTRGAWVHHLEKHLLRSQSLRMQRYRRINSLINGFSLLCFIVYAQGLFTNSFIVLEEYVVLFLLLSLWFTQLVLRIVQFLPTNQRQSEYKSDSGDEKSKRVRLGSGNTYDDEVDKVVGKEKARGWMALILIGGCVSLMARSYDEMTSSVDTLIGPHAVSPLDGALTILSLTAFPAAAMYSMHTLLASDRGAHPRHTKDTTIPSISIASGIAFRCIIPSLVWVSSLSTFLYWTLQPACIESMLMYNDADVTTVSGSLSSTSLSTSPSVYFSSLVTGVVRGITPTLVWLQRSTVIINYFPRIVYLNTALGLVSLVFLHIYTKRRHANNVNRRAGNAVPTTDSKTTTHAGYDISGGDDDCLLSQHHYYLHILLHRMLVLTSIIALIIGPILLVLGPKSSFVVLLWAVTVWAMHTSSLLPLCAICHSRGELEDLVQSSLSTLSPSLPSLVSTPSSLLSASLRSRARATAHRQGEYGDNSRQSNQSIHANALCNVFLPFLSAPGYLPRDKTSTTDDGNISDASYTRAVDQYNPLHTHEAVFSFFLTLLLFFATDHRNQFDALETTSAFVGFDEFNYYLGVSLVLLHTFSAPLLMFLAIPLLATARMYKCISQSVQCVGVVQAYVHKSPPSQACTHAGSTRARTKTAKSDSRANDRRNAHGRDDGPSTSSLFPLPSSSLIPASGILSTSSSPSIPNACALTSSVFVLPILLFVFFFSLRGMLSTINALIQRRHLMVWAIFAPKYIFDAATLLFLLMLSLVGLLFQL